MGDVALLAGSPADANDHYSTAIELSRPAQDFVWCAAALEGKAHALVSWRLIRGQSWVWGSLGLSRLPGVSAAPCAGMCFRMWAAWCLTGRLAAPLWPEVEVLQLQAGWPSSAGSPPTAVLAGLTAHHALLQAACPAVEGEGRGLAREP